MVSNPSNGRKKKLLDSLVSRRSATLGSRPRPRPTGRRGLSHGDWPVASRNCLQKAGTVLNPEQKNGNNHASQELNGTARSNGHLGGSTKLESRLMRDSPRYPETINKRKFERGMRHGEKEFKKKKIHRPRNSGKAGEGSVVCTDEAVGWTTMRQLDWLEVKWKRGTLRERARGPGRRLTPKRTEKVS
jgi:hypothetical protein